MQTDNEKRILFNASFGSFLYFSLKEFATVEDIEESDLAGYLASHDHTLLRDGEEVFDSHGVGEDWLDFNESGMISLETLYYNGNLIKQ